MRIDGAVPVSEQCKAIESYGTDPLLFPVNFCY